MADSINNKQAILVLSCDKYSSLWKPFFTQFHKYWPSCPYTIYLGSNTIQNLDDKRVKIILSGKYKDWSSNLQSILKQIPEKYIFVWLDDLFLTQNVKQETFQKCFRFQEKVHANHIHFEPTITPDGNCTNSLFGFYDKKAPYRVSTVGFWNRDHLYQLLLPGEDPWTFEVFGSYRSRYSNGYYCLTTKLFSYIQIVERGKIFREAYNYCLKNGIQLNTQGWQIHTRFHKIRSDIIRFIFHGIILIPWNIRLTIMNFFRKILATY